MDRVQEIIRHEQDARQPNAQYGQHMWTAARLIWEEVQAGKPQKELAEEIHKSRSHVCWMNKCWEQVRQTFGQNSQNSASLPDFQAIYHSAEIRGASAAQDRSAPTDTRTTERQRRKRDDDQNDYSAHGLIRTAERAITTLIQNRAYSQLLTRADQIRLCDIAARTLALLTESDKSESRKAS